MPLRLTCVLLLAACAPSFCADWNPKLAASYLDARQKAWVEWPPAKATGGTCMSCHTGATYLLARPALRRVLGEKQPTVWETGLLNGLRERAGIRRAADISPSFTREPRASQALGVESVFAALFLVRDDSTEGALSQASRQALDRLWALEIGDGEERGAWHWFSLDLDPYEMPHAMFYGAALAALAAGSAPAEYRQEPGVQTHLAALRGYLARLRETQPLHDRLVLLWASTRLPEAMPEDAGRALMDEVWRQQQADGGWTIQALGPWKEHPGAPAASGSNAYATGLAAFALEKAGVTRSDPRLTRALNWLASHQDKESGCWAGDSMNKKYPAGSIPEGFMRDAATAFAVLALAEDAPRVTVSARPEHLRGPR